MRLVKESHEGPRGASERSGGLPEWRGEFSQLGCAVESYRGTAIERRWHAGQHGKRRYLSSPPSAAAMSAYPPRAAV